MTRLLDTGYLETDDPVVKACFLGHKVIVPNIGPEMLDHVGLVKYTVLIPAATVAEVCGWPEAGYDNPAFILINHVTMTEQRAYQLVPWLEKHTVKGE